MAPFTVLYVDDEPDLLVLGKEFLESIGDFAIDTRLSANEALVTLRARSYDAIISDYQMPEMDGLVFLKTVREEFGDMPFILFTGRGRESVVIEAINYGVDFYLQKGGDVQSQFAELAHKVRKAVERKRAVDECTNSENRFSSLFHASPIHQLITEFSTDRILDINDRFLQDLRLSRKDVTGRTLDDIGLALDPGQYFRIKAQLEQDGVVRNAELLVRARSGKTYATLTSLTRVRVHGQDLIYTQSMDITAQKKADEELRAAYGQLTASQEELRAQYEAVRDSQDLIAESEEKYRILVEHTADGVFITQDGNLVFTNTAFASLIGYAREEIVGRPFPPLIAPEDREMVLLRHRARLIGNTLPENYEFSLLHKDGTTRFRVNIRVGTGTFHGRPATLGTLHDVTLERKREAALAESEELHRKMIVTIPDIIVRADLAGNIVFINAHGVELAGVSGAAEMAGKPMFSFFAPECLPVALENTRRMFERPLGPVEYIFVRRDGTRVVLEVNGDVLRSPDGTPFGIVFICRDTTDRRQAETALRESEEEYRNIIENMQDVFYRVNRDGIITMISPYGARLMGFDSPAEIIGKWRATDFYPDPVEREAFLSYLMQEKKVTGYPLHLRGRHGRLHFATASCRLLYDTHGNIDGIEGILHDVTPIMEVKNSLRQANFQLKLMTDITRHDIRNQLMALSGWLELSQASADDPVRVKELIARGQQVAEVIRQQIDFTAFFDELGSSPPSWQAPLALIEKAHSALPFGTIRLDVDLPAIEIFADPLLEKVFYNLFDNSLRYGGGSMTCIRVHAREQNETLIVVIEDNGAGIAKQDKTHLFERGFGKNTGLGLFLVTEVLSITGLTISESGTPGSGARFEVVVPAGKYRAVLTGQLPG